MALSCYLPLVDATQAERAAVNQETPIFMGHGMSDSVVPFQAGVQSRQILTQLGYAITWNDYAMDHSVCYEEITDIGAWINKTLS